MVIVSLIREARESRQFFARQALGVGFHQRVS
jgi:hypothetical protein